MERIFHDKIHFMIHGEVAVDEPDFCGVLGHHPAQIIMHFFTLETQVVGKFSYGQLRRLGPYPGVAIFGDPSGDISRNPARQNLPITGQQNNGNTNDDQKGYKDSRSSYSFLD